MHYLHNMDILGVPGVVFFICGLFWIPVMFALLGDNPVAGVIAAFLSHLTGRLYVIGSAFVQEFNFGAYEIMVFILMGISIIVAIIAVYRSDISRWMRGPSMIGNGYVPPQPIAQVQAFPHVQPQIFPEPLVMEHDEQQGRPVPFNPERRQ